MWKKEHKRTIVGQLFEKKPIYFLFFLLIICSITKQAEGFGSFRLFPFRGFSKSTEHISVNGIDRKYILHVPAKRKMPSGGFPVVFVFHGGRGSAVSAELMSKMHLLGRDQGFIVVYPEGLYKSWNTDIISVAASEKHVDDVAFFNQLLDRLIAQYKINADKIYICGISNGGHISYYLAEKAGGRIAAFGVVASGLSSEQSYLPAVPKPVMVIHGTEDKHIPYDGGQGVRDRYLAAEKTIQHLIKVNQATAEVLPYQPYPGFQSLPEVNAFYYPGGERGKDVVFIRVNGGGHTWPGGGGYMDKVMGPTSRAISANQALWEFFKSHSRKKGL
ncbi:MAG: hypothetical protein A3G33_06085 [Omnitrophica bacterium RIFCSPLOWO2_12_FULL_44_17]|uniref:Dienelactone hydrolase domain-containing protein n=1 Tax=Candidatus Danuiimicrobium aquiferis TaxID=1801832 RepID=A0A1G1KR25_9BACT|nr:MAG: hypothetical protein A3B72_02575 [Omnitrophica bacterium RIFCSPHIGHO2_02_FULL_45_28]OGW95353.1 MAG: hypothetical protein A3G33_06085 [Omnitrophica bacterium RIFCSPLOWO2_12_FULL_44_17]OGX04058.1 MAG: hypothetical protein A3J12_08655 [Omnitrophica bacterium RIFCSPLOWO2_02_FULL_44_11]